MKAIDILVKYWGHTQFRLNQEKIIQQIIEKKDTLALLPTGGGKSICYQIPTLMQEGISLVISPLIALMNDQIRHLASKGIKSAFITSNMHYSEIDTTLTNCIYGGVKFLYLSPEKLQNDLVKNRIKSMNVTLITVDEAHCISEWGHNFRPSYRHIAEIRSVCPRIPILALTATATKNTITDIQKNLLFKNENLIRSSFLRDNMSYIVDNSKEKNSRLLKILNKIKSPTIIYVGTRKKSKDLTSFLISHNYSANYYHGGLSNEIRNKRQESWHKNQTRIMVATNSFGMGIDKADVKLVIHMHLPSTIESYFQEAGRAGRDEKRAFSFLLANNSDIKHQKKLLNIKYPTINQILDHYQNIANYLQVALGDFPKNHMRFDIVSFSNRYKTNILTTYNVLKYLEKEEKMRFSDDRNSPSRIKLTIKKSELYKFQITNQFYESIIKLLLRSYKNIFDHLIVICEKQIASKLNSTEKEIKAILLRLEQLEILEYHGQNNLSQLQFLEPRQDLKNLNLNEKKWAERKEEESKKLNAISSYISQKGSCRSQLLMDYFGEKETEKCGICDTCIIAKRKAIQNKNLKDI